jgi:hypothetical protein
MRIARMLFPLAAMLAACSGEESSERAVPGPEALVGAGDAADVEAGVASRDVGAASDEADVVAAGSAAAAALTQELIGRVTAAMQEGGAAHAIDFCSEQALPLTASVADALGVEVKRTSTRIRNPANAPDEHEQAALEHFEAEIAAGNELPAYFVQHLDVESRYYRPIALAPFCTACHGSREDLDPAVRDVLDARYPDDRAAGYEAGDFRGVIRVSVPTRDGA